MNLSSQSCSSRTGSNRPQPPPIPAVSTSQHNGPAPRHPRPRPRSRHHPRRRHHPGRRPRRPLDDQQPRPPSRPPACRPNRSRPPPDPSLVRPSTRLLTMSDFSLTLGPVAFAGFELPSSITDRRPPAPRDPPPPWRPPHHRRPRPRPGGHRLLRHLHRPRRCRPSPPAGRPCVSPARHSRSPGTPSCTPWSSSISRPTTAALGGSPTASPAPCCETKPPPSSAPAVELAPSLSADLVSAGSLRHRRVRRRRRTSGATTAGTPAHAAAQASLDTTLSSFDTGISANQAGLGSSDLPTAVASAGLLAQLTAARAYAARAARNLSSAST